MIHGIGTDIVRVSRIEEALVKHGERFAHKVLAERELIEYAANTRRPAVFLAKRFAAKEAWAKAIGTGFRDGLSLRDVAVTHDALGKPGLALAGRAAVLVEQNGICNAHLSLSDENDYAIAFVVLENTR